MARYGLAAASIGAGLIHASAAPGHRAHAAQLAFFVAVAGLQLLWGVALVRRAGWPLLIAGATLNLVVVTVWVLSRTAGLPAVPGAEQAQPVGFKDGVSSLLEIVLVMSVAGLIPRAARGFRVLTASGAMASWVVVAGIGTLTAAAVAAPSHHHVETGHTHSGPAGVAAGDHQDGDDHGHTPAELAAPGHGDGDGHPHAAEEVAEGHTHLADDAGVRSHDHGDMAGRHVHDSATLLAAGDHHEPGHVHSPEHHHAEAAASDDGHGAAHDHAAGTSPEQGPGHDHGTGTAPEDGAGHDHGTAPEDGAGHDHGDDPGHHDGGDGHDHCHEAGGGNPLVGAAQETARALGLGCLATQSSLHIPTAEPRFLEAGVD